MPSTTQYLAGYKPLTDIYDHAKIDFDQAMIESFVELRKMDAAIAVYKEGAFSQSIARLHLKNANPPRIPIPEGTKIVGNTDDGIMVTGRLTETISPWSADTEDVELLVEYDSTSEQTWFCHLGGLLIAETGDFSGCFASKGMITILDFQNSAPKYTYNYTYAHTGDTFNGRTIQGLSTNVDMSFGDSKHYDMFVNYYGAHDYANLWIQAALDGKPTEFLHGNADFWGFDDHTVGKEIMYTAPKVLNVWMYVIRMMEYAVARCNLPCGDVMGNRCDDIPVRAWDQAVAYYAGSLEGEHGEREGIMLYDLADKMCTKFKTCSADGMNDEGTSSVNLRIIDLFSQGQLGLLRRQCSEVDALKNQIINLMAVPLIQSSLYNAHIRNFTSGFEELKGATYAASVLPLIHDCNPEDAETIFASLGLGQSNETMDTVKVKEAFENNYGCLGVTCEDIGGVWEGKYYGQYASPCNYQVEDAKQPLGTLGIIVIICFLLVPMMLAAFFIYFRKRTTRPSPSDNLYDEENLDAFGDVPRNTLMTINLD
mmetsp:Transcript_19739/g.36842  ORF Transcript_19739/g.36842 Transcript_19739/m.36842 type:complete len:539 (-) Transcript_19739:251-1867(-)